MKILMVTMSMNIGGAETHILELCRELVAGGDSVTLASFGGVYAGEAEAAGVRCVTLPLHTKKPGAVLRSYRGLKKLISEGDFDIVHAHARIPAFITGLLHDRIVLDGGRKFRFVTTAHLNFDMNPLWRRISRWGERSMAVSDDIADYLVSEYGYPRERIHTTINGIDTAKFSPEISPAPVLSSLGLDPDRRRIVSLSRLDADRADPAFRLVEIAPRLAEAFPDTDLLIVGGGGELERIRSLAGEVNRALRPKLGRDYVRVTGGVSNTNEYCAASDVFVGVSRSALEAMAAGKAVILAGGQGALGVFRDDERVKQAAVDTNFCCRGFPLADGDALFESVSSLLSLSPEERRKMGEENRAFVLEHYTARRMADDYRRMYARTLASPVPFRLDRVPADLLVSGYYGFGNLGDESLLDVIAQTAAEVIPGVRIAALTRDPKKDALRTGLSCVSRMDLFAVGKQIRRSKVLISGGGSLLQDATSARSLRYYAGLLSYAERHGTPAAVYANGIGPIRSEANRSIAGKAVSAASAVSVRDRDSLEELISLGVPREKIRVTADPAFLIPPASPERIRLVSEVLGVSPGSPEEPGNYIAVSLRPLSRLSKGKKKSDLTPDDRTLVSEVCAAVAEIWKTSRLVPVLVPMQNSQDGRICSLAESELKGKGVPAVLYRPASAQELIGVLGGARFVVGMRLHAVILASSAGAPVIALSYDPKVDGMMKELGQPYSVKVSDFFGNGGNGGSPSGSPTLSSALTGCAREVEARRPEIVSSLAAATAAMRTRAREDMENVKRLLGK